MGLDVFVILEARLEVVQSEEVVQLRLQVATKCDSERKYIYAGHWISGDVLKEVVHEFFGLGRTHV